MGISALILRVRVLILRVRVPIRGTSFSTSNESNGTDDEAHRLEGYGADESVSLILEHNIARVHLYGPIPTATSVRARACER